MLVARSKQQGFTLLELLIASIIFAIMALMAYGGLDNVIRNSDASKQSLQRLADIQKSITLMNRDFGQIIERGIRDEYGVDQHFISAGNNIDNLIEFTRTGRVNPAQLLRSTLLRVGYRFEENELIRLQWSHLDRAQGDEPRQTVLLRDIDDVSIRFMDQNATWQEQWPPVNTAVNATTGQLTVEAPLAIEVTLKLQDWGDIRRIYAVGDS